MSVRVVVKPYGDGCPGFKYWRVVPGLWRWWAWPHEYVGGLDYFCKRGWAASKDEAYRRGAAVARRATQKR